MVYEHLTDVTIHSTEVSGSPSNYILARCNDNRGSQPRQSVNFASWWMPLSVTLAVWNRTVEWRIDQSRVQKRKERGARFQNSSF